MTPAQIIEERLQKLHDLGPVIEKHEAAAFVLLERLIDPNAEAAAS